LGWLRARIRSVECEDGAGILRSKSFQIIVGKNGGFISIKVATCLGGVVVKTLA
jgi:hypothetical protein